MSTRTTSLSIVEPNIDRSAIEWCGPTWNPWQGCIKVSPGCKNCYMYRDKKRYGQDPRKVVRSVPATFNKPLKWQREVEAGIRRGHDRLAFTCSWSDWFIQEADGWRDEAWDIIRRCPGLFFLILTKRYDRILSHLPTFWDEIKGRCWMGVTVEDEATAAERLPSLGDVKATGCTTFVSYEPALGSVDWEAHGIRGNVPVMDQIIGGGESGPDARPSHPGWFRSARDFGVRRSVAFLFKQWGEWAPSFQARYPAPIDGLKKLPDRHDFTGADAVACWKLGKKAAGRLLDGREWNELPTPDRTAATLPVESEAHP
jgi:protein gp37